MPVDILWGNDVEHARAQRIALASGATDQVHVPASRLPLTEVARRLAGARAVIGPDTGLTHLAAALETPVVGLFGPTPLTHVGLQGEHTANLQANLPCVPCRKRQCRLLARDSHAAAPCMAQLQPEQVWHAANLRITPPARRIALENTPG